MCKVAKVAPSSQSSEAAGVAIDCNSKILIQASLGIKSQVTSFWLADGQLLFAKGTCDVLGEEPLCHASLVKVVSTT